MSDDTTALISLLVDIRAAAGDDGKRMQDELVEHIAEMRKDAGRYRFLRGDAPGVGHIVEDMHECALCGEDLDAAIDTAMENHK